ncbi:hypothetical protein CKF54_05430 [Psittacicella hinzii]|uniref:Uncharacterized protein n=1 Tax=Psittacicella hinzii TaxID=2028575 RepID=A0A3A1Y1H6_9GAMM|nr:hypothetical protein [Psittacicella hinzii]RIY32093.1 hypothetical protein CKF54_05430 [Psittacicella hinzii]
MAHGLSKDLFILNDVVNLDGKHYFVEMSCFLAFADVVIDAFGISLKERLSEKPNFPENDKDLIYLEKMIISLYSSTFKSVVKGGRYYVNYEEINSIMTLARYAHLLGELTDEYAHLEKMRFFYETIGLMFNFDEDEFATAFVEIEKDFVYMAKISKADLDIDDLDEKAQLFFGGNPAFGIKTPHWYNKDLYNFEYRVDHLLNYTYVKGTNGLSQRWRKFISLISES